MTTGQLAPVLRYIRRVREAAADDSDRALLERFARHRDAEAFALLVRRHGPMVLGVCRRVLHNGHDADDAFQAVFLLLLRKAGSLRRPEQLGPWLHGVAHRVALKARCLRLRRREREEPLADPPAPPAADELVWRDLRPVLDDAVRSLPAKYRTPFVLCYLQGMTNAEAARRLGCPPGTVATRLSRAREQLRARLVRRGVTLSAAALAAALAGAAEASVPPPLLAAVLRTCLVPGTLPVHLTALTEGVCQAMLMEKLRFVVMALVAAAAVGAIVMGYRSGAAEPGEPPAAIPPPPAVVLPAPRADKGGAVAVVEAKNFTVTAPTRGLATLFAEAAERHRKEQALRWLGMELPAWPEPCPIRVRITMASTGGATTFEFAEEPILSRSLISRTSGGGQEGSIIFQNKVKSRNMHLEGSLERLLISALPHEVAHSVFADYFGKPIVRWADEGAAVLSEDPDEQERHQRLARQIMETPGRAIALRRLIAMRDFPPEVMSLYTEGYSVTRFLVEKKDRKTFLAFVKRGMSDGWDRAVKEHYDFRDVEALEDAWLADLRKAVKPISPAPADKVGEELPIPPSVPPATGVAVIDKEGRLRLREVDAVALAVPVRRPVGRGGKDGEDVVTAYATQQVMRFLDPAETPVYGMDGQRIDPKKLPELLRKEIPVLIARDGQMVDPFHLRLIKDGTLIVAPPPRPAVPVRPAPPVAPAS